MKPPLHSTSSRPRETPRSPWYRARSGSNRQWHADQGVAESQLRWQSLDQFDGGKDRYHELVLSSFLFHQRAHDLIDLDSQHRFVQALAACQKDQPVHLMLGKLHRLVTVGYIHSLLAFWDHSADDASSGGFPATLAKLSNLSAGSECTFAFPLSEPEICFEESSLLLFRLMERATKSMSYQRLKAYRDGHGLDISPETSQKTYLDPTDPLLNYDIDKMFVYSCFALQSFNDRIFSRDLERVRAIVGRSREQCRTMWMSVEELAERGGLAEVGAGSPRRATEEQADPAPRRSNIGFEAFLIGPLLGFCIWAPIIWAVFFFF